eukprot:14230942-Ditylum_brightwellii.AAC.1
MAVDITSIVEDKYTSLISTITWPYKEEHNKKQLVWSSQNNEVALHFKAIQGNHKYLQHEGMKV